MDGMSASATQHQAATILAPLALGVPPQRPKSAGINVLHIIEPGEVGGAETVVRELARAQKGQGASVTVAAIVHADAAATSFLEALRDDSIETHRVQVPGRAYMRERRE